MINTLVQKSLRSRAKSLVRDISPHVKDGGKILDYGCGDGLVSEILVENGANVTMIDVINANISNLPSTVYDGKKIPFPDRAFDTSMALYVFHHTDNPENALRELSRVTKNRIVIAEDVCRYELERPLLEVCDSFNKLIDRDMSLTFNFKTQKGWFELFDKLGLEIEGVYPLHANPPTPVSHRCFVLRVK